jgi:hypothetical protein
VQNVEKYTDKEKLQIILRNCKNLINYSKNGQCASIAKYANLLALIEDLEKAIREMFINE